MANASGLATEKIKTGELDHKPSSMQYVVSLENDQAFLSYRDTRNPEVKGKWKLDYFLGSGHLGVTYLYSIQGYLMESPVAFYAASQSLDMKPGLENITQMPPALPMQAGCLRCHMSGVQRSDAGTINHYSSPAFLQTGITCESCHGDAAQHVRTGGKAPVVNPAKLDAERRDSVCISCHLEGDVSVERVGRSELDYKPGDAISNYLAYFVYASKNVTKRGVSEVEQLSESRCKRVSGDKMSCTTCHDPHFTPSVAERAAFYRGKCLTCHEAGFAATHHPENPDCTTCHMPRSGAENIPHVAWTDHRIHKQADVVTLENLLEKGDELTPIFSPGVTKRDLGMAYYKTFLDGNPTSRMKAYDLLSDQRMQINDDKDALAALGILSEGRGDSEQARQIFMRVRQLDPGNLTAASNLGTLAGRAGDIKEAIALWQAPFARNEDIPGLAKNLATVQCMAGDVVAARATLEATLVFSPGLHDVRQLLAQLPACGSAKH
jgi:tetratricopeptide (TPR) repeat protein